MAKANGKAVPKRTSLRDLKLDVARPNLAQEAEKLSIMLAAINQLSLLADDDDMAARDAASVAIEAVSVLGSLRADALSRGLGGSGAGCFSEELKKLHLR